MQKLLVILGPTATGKTDLALNLAKKFNGEIISCDSRQVYTGLDIGTGKMPSQIQMLNIKKRKGYWEVCGVRIWMYDVVNPRIQYTVFNYVKDVSRAVEDISNRGKLPIIVGGSGLYLKALLEGLDSLSVPVDKNLRKGLEKLSLSKLQKKLQEVNPKKWEKMNQSDRQNPRRLVRAIEIVTNLKLKTNNLPQAEQNYDVLKIGLIAPREILYKRVDGRVIKRINQGMIEEVKRLHKEGLTFKRMRQFGLEYGVLADYLEGKIKSKEDLMKIMQGKIHGYVRRQITWFKNPSTRFAEASARRAGSGYINWFDITDKSFPKNVEKITSKWYHHSDDTKNRHLS